MEPKDFVAVGLSLFAIGVSVVTFFLTHRQRKIESIRNTRQTLSDAVGQLAEISLAVARVNGGHASNLEHAVLLRRIYNSQRSHWANQAEQLMSWAPDVANAVDHNILAVAFDAIGDYDKAEQHWKKCVDTSVSPGVRAMHLRGYARFLFFQGNPDLGRRMYEQSVQIPLPATDHNRRIKSDTYSMWGRVEHDFGHTHEAARLVERAIAAANTIGHRAMREDTLAAIGRWITAATVTTPAPESISLPTCPQHRPSNEYMRT